MLVFSSVRVCKFSIVSFKALAGDVASPMRLVVLGLWLAWTVDEMLLFERLLGIPKGDIGFTPRFL